MNHTFEVIETFEITGRGLVVVLAGGIAALPHVSPLLVAVHVHSHPSFHTKAFHEILLRRTTTALESSALLLPELGKTQVPIGSVVEVESNAA